jgi:biopolymer transport protein ExbD
MAFSTGGAGGAMGEINVTPMIDILLVLLIIFMVIVPVTPRGLDALVPQPPKNPTQQQPNDRTIVVQVLYRPGQAPAYKINETDVNRSDLQQRLTDIYANRAERVMFVKGDDDVNFGYIADVIDIGKAASVDHIGLMTPKIQAGQ